MPVVARCLWNHHSTVGYPAYNQAVPIQFFSPGLYSPNHSPNGCAPALWSYRLFGQSLILPPCGTNPRQIGCLDVTKLPGHTIHLIQGAQPYHLTNSCVTNASADAFGSTRLNSVWPKTPSPHSFYPSAFQRRNMAQWAKIEAAAIVISQPSWSDSTRGARVALAWCLTLAHGQRRSVYYQKSVASACLFRRTCCGDFIPRCRHDLLVS
ncbi:hypothetical protein HDK77DRAFT_58003 [Phyllosticta capitalensis]|uniref:Uncharacterized protein n=1 Tax=Phyllosticta capitalensis TaxID=121624 RepID=A0ABR1YA94_9PEZI